MSFDVDFVVWGSVVSGERYEIPDNGGYLYDEGSYEDFWVGSSDGAGEKSKEEDHLRTVGGPDTDSDGSGWHAWVTEEKIDVEPYETLVVDWEGIDYDSDFGAVGVSLTSDQESNPSPIEDAETGINESEPFSRTVDTHDISDFNEEYYIATYAYDYASGNERETENRTFSIQLE